MGVSRRIPRLRRAAGITFLMLVAGSGVKAVSTPAITRPVCRFIYFYENAETTNAPMRLWERLLYSFVLSKSKAAEDRACVVISSSE